MDFEEKLKQAISRGKDRAEVDRVSDASRQMTHEELRRRHTECRLDLSEYIEQVLRKLATHFPGFTYETVYGERGWGGGLSRDDLMRGGSFFSRIEIVVRPYNNYNVVNISGKGTVKNREIANWNHFQEVALVDLNEFRQKIDSWILLYAEQFAAK